MALHSPDTGIIDYGLVTNAFAKNFISKQGTVVYNFQVAYFYFTYTCSRDIIDETSCM